MHAVCFYEDRRLANSGSLWARRKLSFDLRKEFSLDFREAFKTITQHFGVPKWMVETGRKPQVVSGQKARGGRCLEVSKQSGLRAVEGHTRARELQCVEPRETRERRRVTAEEETMLKDSCGQRLGRRSMSCQGNTFIPCKPGFRGTATVETALLLAPPILSPRP